MDIGYIITVLVVILLSVTLHEAMHAFMGYFLGDDTAKAQGRLTLNPIKHIDPFMTIILPIFLAVAGGPIFGGAKPVPFNPNRLRYGEWGAAMVALAGPLTNFFIAFLAFGVVVLFSASPAVVYIGTLIVMVNLGFFVFNMLPIPPLDGSRLLYALAPENARRIMEQIERFGVFVIFAIVMLGSVFIWQFMSSIIQAILILFTLVFQV